MRRKDESIKIKRAKLSLAENARRDAQRRNALERKAKIVDTPPKHCPHGEIIVTENTCRICKKNLMLRYHSRKVPYLPLQKHSGPIPQECAYDTTENPITRRPTLAGDDTLGPGRTIVRNAKSNTTASTTFVHPRPTRYVKARCEGRHLVIREQLHPRVENIDAMLDYGNGVRQTHGGQ
ncbi:unnamed protein product, partial [Trichogramma brassicae]